MVKDISTFSADDYSLKVRLPRFIHFFGVDGVGKTTQATFLACWLKRNGINVKIVRIRSGRTFASLLYRFLGKLATKYMEYGGDGRLLRINLIKSAAAKQFWSLIEFISMIPWLVRSVFIPLSMGKTIVAERYVIDAIATISYLINDPRWSNSFLSRLLLRFIPCNDSIFIHLDAPYEEIMRRRGIFTDPRKYIEFQRIIYNKFAKALSAIMIDTSMLSKEETFKLICYILKNKYRMR